MMGTPLVAPRMLYAAGWDLAEHSIQGRVLVGGTRLAVCAMHLFVTA